MLFYKTLDFIWEKNLARLNPQITLSIVLKILVQYAGPLELEQFKGGRGNNLPFLGVLKVSRSRNKIVEP